MPSNYAATMQGDGAAAPSKYLGLMQAEASDDRARFGAGLLFNFSGTGGMWRREAIRDAGGWQHDTLTEDLDLSYRAQLAGWRFVYREDHVTPAELPEEMEAFRAQQFRWAKGTVQTSRKLLRRVVLGPAFVDPDGRIARALADALAAINHWSAFTGGGAMSQKSAASCGRIWRSSSPCETKRTIASGRASRRSRAEATPSAHGLSRFRWT